MPSSHAFKLFNTAYHNQLSITSIAFPTIIQN